MSSGDDDSYDYGWAEKAATNDVAVFHSSNTRAPFRFTDSVTTPGVSDVGSPDGSALNAVYKSNSKASDEHADAAIDPLVDQPKGPSTDDRLRALEESLTKVAAILDLGPATNDRFRTLEESLSKVAAILERSGERADAMFRTISSIQQDQLAQQRMLTASLEEQHRIRFSLTTDSSFSTVLHEKKRSQQAPVSPTSFTPVVNSFTPGFAPGVSTPSLTTVLQEKNRILSETPQQAHILPFPDVSLLFSGGYHHLSNHGSTHDPQIPRVSHVDVSPSVAPLSVVSEGLVPPSDSGLPLFDTGVLMTRPQMSKSCFSSLASNPVFVFEDLENSRSKPPPDPGECRVGVCSERARRKLPPDPGKDIEVTFTAKPPPDPGECRVGAHFRRSRPSMPSIAEYAVSCTGGGTLMPYRITPFLLTATNISRNQKSSHTFKLLQLLVDFTSCWHQAHGVMLSQSLLDVISCWYQSHTLLQLLVIMMSLHVVAVAVDSIPRCAIFYNPKPKLECLLNPYGKLAHWTR